MITGVAFVPSTPLLIPAVASGAAPELDAVRAACLLAVRRGLTLDNPADGRALLDRSTRILDSDRISPQSRQELTSIVYSLRADGLTGTGTGR